MAVEYLLDDEEDDKTTSDGSSAGEQIAGAPALPTSSQPQDNPGTASGSYTNLQKYIEANKGRDFGGQVAGKIEGETQQGLNQLNQAEGNFKSAVDSGSYNLSDELKQRITDAPQALSQEEKDTAKTIRTGTYKGPESFSGGVEENDPYAQLRQYFSGLEETKKGTESDVGQETLLNKYYGRPTYTQGEKALDSFILGNQNAPVRQAQQNIGSAIDSYKQKSGEMNKYASDAKGRTKASQSDYYALLGLDPAGSAKAYKYGDEPQGLIQKDLDRLNKQASAKKSAADTQYAALKANGRDLTNPQAAIFKNLGGVDRTYGLNPADYLTSNGDINYQTAASPEDLARLNALTDLAGLGQDYLNPNAVGTMDNEDPYSFNLEKFLADQDIRKGNYLGALRDTRVSTPEAMANQYGANGTLEDLINKGASQYEAAKNSIVGLDPELGGSVKFQQSGMIDPYERLLKQREDLRKQYGYYDLIKR